MSGATERLFFNADKSKIVHEDDPDAAFLAAGVGDEIPEGFTAPKKAKEAEKASNKSADKPDTK